MPANVPEASVTDALEGDLAAQHSTLKERHIDRAYLGPGGETMPFEPGGGQVSGHDLCELCAAGTLHQERCWAQREYSSR